MFYVSLFNQALEEVEDNYGPFESLEEAMNFIREEINIEDNLIDCSVREADFNGMWDVGTDEFSYIIREGRFATEEDIVVDF